MPLWKYSQVAASNGVADPSSPFPEGQAPSSVNDSVRGMMAALAMYRDDISGAIVTGGTNVAYTVATFSGFDTLAHLDKQMVAFTPHTTNGAGPLFLNVDSTGSKPLRPSPGVEFPAGVIIIGTPYVAVYNNTDGAWYVQGGFGNPYNVPLGVGMDYWLPVAPNSAFVFPVGQAISRTVYATLFAGMGTANGAGDGANTFNLPDKRGRVSAGLDPGNGTGRLNNNSGFGGINGAVLGGFGGEQSHQLTVGELPPITPSGSISSVSNSSVSGGIYGGTTQTTLQVNGGAQLSVFNSGAIAVSTSTVSTFFGNQIGSNGFHNNVQPTIMCNYIMRII